MTGGLEKWTPDHHSAYLPTYLPTALEFLLLLFSVTAGVKCLQLVVQSHLAVFAVSKMSAPHLSLLAKISLFFGPPYGFDWR